MLIIAVRVSDGEQKQSEDGAENISWGYHHHGEDCGILNYIVEKMQQVVKIIEGKPGSYYSL